ncbi:MAG: hypothetical protein L0271_10005, partial [Gemmatimonadetes bacterium]|nr:hypothetical protein [Gemmatimonadota bacterium]
PRGGIPQDTAATSQAITFFEERLRRDPINATIATRLAGRYMLRFQRNADLSDVRRAEMLLGQALPFVYDPADVHASLSAVRLTQHDFAGAWSSALDAANAEGREAAAWGALFDAGMAMGRYEEAEEALVRLEPGTLAGLLRRAHWLDATGDPSGAFAALSRVCEQLERAAARPETLAWCFTELAGIDASRSGRAGARRWLRRALQALPGYRGAIEGLADMAHAAGEWRRAFRLYESIAVDAHPDLYLRLAESHRALGHHAEADRWEREFLRVAADPVAEALYAHPLALYYAGRPATRGLALEIALRDVERRPAVDSWDVLSRVYFARGELREALEAADHAHAFGAPSQRMIEHRARIIRSLQQAPVENDVQ